MRPINVEGVPKSTKKNVSGRSSTEDLTVMGGKTVDKHATIDTRAKEYKQTFGASSLGRDAHLMSCIDYRVHD